MRTGRTGLNMKCPNMTERSSSPVWRGISAILRVQRWRDRTSQINTLHYTEYYISSSSSRSRPNANLNKFSFSCWAMDNMAVRVQSFTRKRSTFTQNLYLEYMTFNVLACSCFLINSSPLSLPRLPHLAFLFLRARTAAIKRTE